MSRKIIILFVATPLFVMITMLIILLSLDMTQNNVKKPADIIVVLGGGLGSRIEKAWKLQTQGLSKSDKILITGIPLNPEKVVGQHPFLKYLKDHPEIKYQFVSISETTNTWKEALYIKQYMQKHNYHSIIIVTHPLHSGRVKMALDKVAHFKHAGLEYTIIGDRKIDFWKSFWNDKKFRSFALKEVMKQIGYGVKAIWYNAFKSDKGNND